MAKFGKPESLYTVFDRKETVQNSTHYCPGCGHGIAHKLIARVIDELRIQDRTIMCSPVGCSVFLYYYFDTGNVQCSHGRAPAVATGMRRNLEDAIIVSYQGDGDLAGIGTAEIIHAANRGENITVLFINNAIYGMTGGQMAPTTLVGQKTTTTPGGRTIQQDGGPIGMAELMNALPTPVYIERVSLSSPKNIVAAEKAIKKGIVNQIDKKGFSFVEILSPCPVNWKMEPFEALAWIKTHLEPVFPVKVFRDNSASAVRQLPYAEIHPWLSDADLTALFRHEVTGVVPRCELAAEQQVKIGGFGGQGVMLVGTLLADCAVARGLNATWLPSYGPEMRGGTSNASVIISKDKIGSPVVNDPNVLIAMNTPSLELFENSVQKGGMILVNSSLIAKKVSRSDVTAIYVPATDLAKEENFIAGANIIMLTVYLLTTGVIDIDTIRAVVPVSTKKRQFAELNLKMIERGKLFFESSTD